MRACVRACVHEIGYMSGQFVVIHKEVLNPHPFEAAVTPKLTKGYLFPCVRGQDEEQEGQGGDEHARKDDVEAVVECATSDVDGEGQIDVELRTAFVLQYVPLYRYA